MSEIKVDLDAMLYSFDINMTSSDWNELGIYSDDGMAAVGAFVDYVKSQASGQVDETALYSQLSEKLLK